MSPCLLNPSTCIGLAYVFHLVTIIIWRITKTIVACDLPCIMYYVYSLTPIITVFRLRFAFKVYMRFMTDETARRCSAPCPPDTVRRNTPHITFRHSLNVGLNLQNISPEDHKRQVERPPVSFASQA